MDQPAPVLVFYHIPKTAGNTLRGIFIRQFRPTAMVRISPDRDPEVVSRGMDRVLIECVDGQRQSGVMLEETLQWIEHCDPASALVVMGHIPFGLHRFVEGRQCVTMTMLRNPVERFISNIAYKYKREDAEFLELVLLSQPAHRYNLQTRFLGTRHGVFEGQVADEAMLVQAKANLDTLSVVGLLESFDAALLQLAMVMGWKRPYYVALNQSKNRVQRHQTSQAVIQELTGRHALDWELYQAARQKVSHNMSQWTPEFAQELERFQKRNRQLSPLTRLQVALWGGPNYSKSAEMSQK